MHIFSDESDSSQVVLDSASITLLVHSKEQKGGDFKYILDSYITHTEGATETILLNVFLS